MKILIVLPAYNEQIVLEKSVRQTWEFCQKNFATDDCQIVVADNNSRDRTAEIAQRLAQEIPQVGYFFVAEKGKGIAWRSVFLKEQADIYIVMDIDLAVSLEDVKLLIAGINDGYDLVVGSRFLKDSKVERSFLRDLASAVYRLLVRIILKTKISDFQCGFKALNQKIKEEILPQTEDKLFFLDTEIVALTEKFGYKIKEVPVNWSQYRDLERKSTVNVFETTIEYLIKIWRLRKKINQLLRNR